jgi:hypothetical protein
MREIDRLSKHLFPEQAQGSKVLDLKFFPGEELVTEDQFCEAVHAVFVHIDSGQAASSDSFPEISNQVLIDRFLGVRQP